MLILYGYRACEGKKVIISPLFQKCKYSPTPLTLSLMKEMVLFLVEPCSSWEGFLDLLGTVYNEFREIREHQRPKRESVKVSL